MDNRFTTKVKQRFIKEMNKDKWLRKALKKNILYKQHTDRQIAFGEKLHAMLYPNKEMGATE